jgi:hypothetical protein
MLRVVFMYSRSEFSLFSLIFSIAPEISKPLAGAIQLQDFSLPTNIKVRYTERYRNVGGKRSENHQGEEYSVKVCTNRCGTRDVEQNRRTEVLSRWLMHGKARLERLWCCIAEASCLEQTGKYSIFLAIHNKQIRYVVFFTKLNEAFSPQRNFYFQKPFLTRKFESRRCTILRQPPVSSRIDQPIGQHRYSHRSKKRICSANACGSISANLKDRMPLVTTRCLVFLIRSCCTIR